MNKVSPFSFLLFSLLLIPGCMDSQSSNKTSSKEDFSKVDPVIKSIVLDHIMGRFQPDNNKHFELIEEKYASRSGMYLHKETYAAFKKMYTAAEADGVNLKIRSATRNFFDQKRIWENKWNGVTLVEGGQNLAESVPNAEDRALIILRYSSMPGTSRHHWGTDIDINSFENSYFESGQGLKEYKWLVENAPSFGFCQPYTAKDELRPNGYFEEKWHWSYLPVAQSLTSFLEQHLQNDMIDGFLGATTAKTIGIKQNYMMGINQECLSR